MHWFDTQKICFVAPCQELTLHCWYWHSWLCYECAPTEICVIITRSTWNYCHLGSNHCHLGSSGFTGSRRPQHHLRLCCCTRAYASVISWQNDRLGKYKQVPSLSGATPSSPLSARTGKLQSRPQNKFLKCNFSFCVSTIKIALFQ